MSLFKDKIELKIEEAELAGQKQFLGFPTWFRWVLVVWAIVILPVYFVSKSISYNIWQKRYAQGATLAKPSFTATKDPVVSKITVTTFKSGSYSALMQITNPNFDLSLDKVPYQVVFSNSEQQQVYSYPDELYLLPNQTKYLTVPTFSLSDSIAYANLVLPPKLPWQKRLQIPTVELLTSQPSTSFQNSPPAFVVNGDFTNNSPYTLGKVRLVFVLFDSDNNIISVSQRDEFTVAPFERRGYSQLWPNTFPGNSVKAEVDAYTDSLDENNLVISSPPSGNSSDLSRPTTNNGQ